MNHRAPAIWISMAICGIALSSEWPSWRGPDGTGSTQEAGPAKPEMVWKAELPGRGCSTPVVWNETIYLTSAIDGKDAVLAFDLKGKEQWRHTLGKLRPGRGQRVGSSANSSPVTDGEMVYVYFKSGNFAAMDMDGKERWSLNVFERYGKDHLWWDVGTSPVLSDDKVMLAVMQTEGDSYIVAFDKKTGKEVWKTARQFETGKESGDAYTTPLIREIDGIETLITWGADHLTGHAVDDGKLLWTCGGFNPAKKGMWRVIASAPVDQGIAVVPYGRGKGLNGVKLGGQGDITESAMLWKADLGSDSATPALKDGKVYVLSDSGKSRGVVSCLDQMSGKLLWQTRLPRGPQIYYASPFVAGNRFYAAREDGALFSASITDTGLEDIHQTSLEETLTASPLVFSGKLLIRGDKHLYCFK